MKNKLIPLETNEEKASAPKSDVPLVVSKLLFEYSEIPSIDLPNDKPLLHNSQQKDKHLMKCQLPHPPAISVTPSEDSELQQICHCS